MRRRARCLVALAVVLGLTACGQSTALAPVAPTASGGARPSPEATELRGELVVLAATSLTAAFTELAAELESHHPRLEVTISFGGSSGLAQQIASGAPADVFAAASTATMQTAVAALQEAAVPGAESLSPVVFATSSMALVVPRANEAGIADLADLDRAGITFAVCARQVPCGAAAARVLASAGIVAMPVTLERDVTAVLVKVRRDEVDAGIVYVTDVDESVTAIDIPPELDATTSYPVLALPGSPNPEAAIAFTELVLSPAGRAVLDRHGFGAP